MCGLTASDCVPRTNFLCKKKYFSALGNNKVEQLFYYTVQTKLVRFLNYLTAILTANNELFNSASENDDEFRMYVRNYYFF